MKLKRTSKENSDVATDTPEYRCINALTQNLKLRNSFWSK